MPLPIAAAATPSTISVFPSGRRRSERSATPTTASVPSAFARIASRRAGRKARWSCAGGIPCAANAPCTGIASATPTARPAYDEARPRAARRTPASSERAGAEERRRQQRAGRVVDAERARVPLRRLAPGDRRRGDRIGGERPGPGGELGPPRRAPAAREQAGEPQREQRGGEGEERVHAAERSGAHGRPASTPSARCSR